MMRVGVLGAGGRMGAAVIAALAAEPDCLFVGGVERAGHPAAAAGPGSAGAIGTNTAPLARRADVLIDFSSPDALAEHLRAAVDAGTAILVGTTGLSPSHHAAIDSAARDIAVLQAANTAIGITVLEALAEAAAAALGPGWDAEIVEWHHRDKLDAPSGTALALGEAVARGRGQPLEALRLGPDRTGTRRAGGIGLASVRAGTVAGEHQLILAAPGERLLLAHSAEDRALFARGAVRAARWLCGRPPGRYRMRDVLALSFAAQASPG